MRSTCGLCFVLFHVCDVLAFKPSTSSRVPSNYCLVYALLGEFSGTFNVPSQLWESHTKR